MKVLRFQAHNVLKIKDVDFDLAGHHLFLIGGDNGAGKTSALAAVRMALCGRSGSDYPEVALREGQNEGWVKVELGDDEKLAGLTVELFLKRGRSGAVAEKFRVLDAQGREAPSPRAVLDRLYEMRAFDPMTFEKLGRKEKRETLCKLVGLDFAESNKRHKEVYDERTAVNREGTKLRAKFDGMPQHKEVEGQDRIDVQALMEDLEKRQDANRANADPKPSA